MEVVTMEKKAFDLMMARYDALVQKVELLKHKANGKRLNKWLTGHEVCQQLRISQRTLQKLRDRRFLGHTQIGRQFYYQKTFQHTATGTEPVCPFFSGKLL